VADKAPDETAKYIQPTLEDAYLYRISHANDSVLAIEAVES
jgi:hypothetical protein